MSELLDKARELQRVSTFTFEQAVAALDRHPDLDLADAVAVARLVSGPDDGTPEHHTRLSMAVEYFLNVTATDPPAEPIVIDGATWEENTGFWQDGVQSWRLQSSTWTVDIRRDEPSSFGWTVRSETARDRGTAPTLASAQEHAATWVRNHGEQHMATEETKVTETERGMFYSIKVPTPEELRGYGCCELSCQEPGIWLMVTGPSPDDITVSCAAHVADLLGDASLLGITRIEAPAVDYLEVVLDGDPHEGGRFVRVDGAYGKEPGRRGTLLPAGGLAPVWVQRGVEHVLRIPVYAGAMFG